MVGEEEGGEGAAAKGAAAVARERAVAASMVAMVARLDSKVVLQAVALGVIVVVQAGQE